VLAAHRERPRRAHQHAEALAVRGDPGKSREVGGTGILHVLVRSSTWHSINRPRPGGTALRTEAISGFEAHLGKDHPGDTRGAARQPVRLRLEGPET